MLYTYTNPRSLYTHKKRIHLVDIYSEIKGGSKWDILMQSGSDLP